MNCEATTGQTPHIATSDPAADQNSDFLQVSTFLPVHIQQSRDQRPASGSRVMDADNADNAMLPGLYKSHEAPSRLSQRHHSCKESELLLETV